MRKFKAANQVKGIFAENQLYDAWLQNTSEGLMLCRENEILYRNSQCRQLLSPDDDNFPAALDEIFETEERARLFKGEVLTCFREKNTLKVTAVSENGYRLFMIQDLTIVEELKRKSNEIKQLNKELQTVYEQYADDTIFITDGNGKVEFSGAMTAVNCGVTTDYMVGKSVYDLEKERVFYPSVTVRVLESRQPEVIIQTTKPGRQFVTIGTPIFNEKGEITKVISVTRDYSKQIKIGTLLSMVEEGKNSGRRLNGPQGNIVTCNDKMLQILELIRLVAKVNSTVLIYGETGTGKEMIARHIHNCSARAGKPFIKVNCGAIAPNLVESELFGYEPGSFTGASKGGKIGLIEASNEGTLFLDEISELPLNQQVKLLQVLQEGSLIKVGGTKSINLNIRVIAATNKKLEEQVQKGAFREDLFYRLNVVPINLPPLRERVDDIALLITRFLKINNAKYGMEKRFTKEAFNCLCGYSWPGNVRELENTVERLMITTQSSFVEKESLPDNIVSEFRRNGEAVLIKRLTNLNDAIEETEKKLIIMAMKKYGTETKAAEALGVNQSTISRKMKYYGL